MMMQCYRHVMTRLLLSIGLIVISTLGRAEPIVVRPDAGVIVVPADAHAGDPAKIAFAAEELGHHLRLITGTELPVIRQGDAIDGRYPFHVGIAPSGSKPSADAESATWIATPEAAYFFGDDSTGSHGTRSAVYAFLEDQLAVRWIEPGDIGIAYRAQTPLIFHSGESRWAPDLVFRKIRQSIRTDQPHRPIDAPFTDAFLLSVETHNAKVADEVLWQQRMRMGGSRPGGGHAFSDWWSRFGETHPDYFALNRFGKREPVPVAKAHQTHAYVKICPSNPKVAEQVIADWLPQRHRRRYVNVGLNDGSQNFCECPDCRALDMPLPGEAWDAHLTDRYVVLANRVARMARAHRADAYVSMYAYLRTLEPPRRETLEPNIVVHIAPYVDPPDLDIVRRHFAGWRDAGATQIALRPNYHHKYFQTAMPLGIEKHMFDVFQTAVEHGCISADYDMLLGHWPLSGLPDYILAKAMSDPSKPFAYWEDHYCQAYGAAAEEVKRYFRFWRTELWDQRLAPDLTDLATRGRAGNFSRGLMWNLADYYRLSDFERAGAILGDALRKPLTASERQRLDQLVLANRHARKVFSAITASGQEHYRETQALMAFRQTHKDALRMSWVRLIGWEARYANPTLRLAERLQDYPLPWLATGMAWHFKMDPDNVGRNEAWQALPYEQTETWDRLRVDNFWEQAYRSETDPDLFERLKQYDGIGWYAGRILTPTDLQGRHILMHIGGVGDGCKVYVNGRLAGEYEVTGEQAKTLPFTIRIDPHIDWDQRFQHFTIRVHNESGRGGLYGRIWIVSREGDS